MVKQIISIEGIDNSGKSLIIKKVKKYLEDNSLGPVKTTSKMNLHQLSKLYPKNPKKVREFYTQAPIENVVRALLEINKRKAEIIKKSDEKYVLLDRGYLSTISGCTAQVMTRKNCSFEKALKLVKKINKEIKYSPIEKSSIFLSINKKDSIKIFKQREKNNSSENHLNYIKNFGIALDNLSKQDFGINKYSINGLETKSKTYEEFLNIFKEISLVKYQLFVNELLRDSSKKELHSIIMGGSYIRGDLIPEWSDLDAIFVLKNNTDKKKVRRRADKISKKYGIRFNPRLIHKKELDNLEKLQLKVLIFFLPKYESKAIFGKKETIKLPRKTIEKKSKEALIEIKKFLEDLYENSTKDQIVMRGIRNCFNIVKIVLLKNGTIVSSYEDTIKKGRKIKNIDKLKHFLKIRDNWNKEKINYSKTIKEIKKFTNDLLREYKI